MRRVTLGVVCCLALSGCRGGGCPNGACGAAPSHSAPAAYGRSSAAAAGPLVPSVPTYVPDPRPSQRAEPFEGSGTR